MNTNSGAGDGFNDALGIRRELNGSQPRQESRTKRSRGNRGRQQPTTQSRQPKASERASMLAQIWYDHGEREGFSFPYDVNYLALALQRKVENDPEMKVYLAKERHDQVNRWVSKMIEIWWNPVDRDDNGGYLTGDVNQRNAKDYFLDTDWDDLRDYARSSLRAQYLMEHGKRVPPPLYPEQQEYRDRLRELRSKAVVDVHVRQLEERPEPEPLDERGRERLRSFVEKRRKK